MNNDPLDLFPNMDAFDLSSASPQPTTLFGNHNMTPRSTDVSLNSPPISGKSCLFKYFTKTNSGIRCNFLDCERNNTPYSKKTGNGTLTKHLRSQHLNELEQSKKERGNLYVSIANRLDGHFNMSTDKSSPEVTKEEMETILSLIINVIIENELPFSFIESPALLKLIQYLNPSVKQLQCRQTVQRRIVNFASSMKENVIQKLSQVSSQISLTLDLWTSVSQRPYIASTAHWIDSNWVMKSVLLEIKQLPNPHTDKCIADYMLKVLLNFGISGKIIGVTTDNGANVVAGMKLLAQALELKDSHMVHRRCCAHILNLVVRAAHPIKIDLEIFTEEEQLISMSVSKVKKINYQVTSIICFERRLE
ncbi:hypothetical protein P9112_010078 [Eukaryota sp. TZLM1-RC]